jgi:hypothetical protein
MSHKFALVYLIRYVHSVRLGSSNLLYYTLLAVSYRSTDVAMPH